MNMINAKPLFGIAPDGRIYDYTLNKMYPPTGQFKTASGTWDAAKLVAAISAGQNILSALVGTAGVKGAAAGTGDKVDQANRDFRNQGTVTGQQSAAGGGLQKRTPPPGLDAEQLAAWENEQTEIESRRAAAAATNAKNGGKAAPAGTGS